MDANNNNNQHEEVVDEALRQRLYVDLQRPRPFYRTTASISNENNTQVVNENEIIHQNPPSLQVFKNLLLHTVRNLHFLSKNSTLISRENCRFFSGEKLVKMLLFWTF